MRQNPNYNALRSRNKIKLLSENVFAGLQNLQILWAETILKFIVLNFISSLLKKEKNMHRKKLLFNLLGTWKRTTFLRSTRTPSCRWTISRICKWCYLCLLYFVSDIFEIAIFARGNYIFQDKNISSCRNLGQNSFAVLPSKGLKTIVELKAHNNPALKDFPTAEVSSDEVDNLVVVVVVVDHHYTSWWKSIFRASLTSVWWDQAMLTTAASSCPPPTRTW